MNYREFSKNLKSEFDAFQPAKVSIQFNVLDEMHANENAHTRILARLLQVQPVCRSFIEYLAKKRPDLSANLLAGTEGEFFVNCFSEYIDAKIQYGENVIIIENKVKDAVDQDRQIDRYVQKEMEKHEHKQECIYVIYLTQDGKKKVADYSFSDTKHALGFESEERSGRFIALNYKDHIIDWLGRHLSFSMEELEVQPYLRSGILQYLHYIKGPDLLDERKEEDPYEKFRMKLKSLIKDVGLDVTIDALSELYKDSLVTTQSQSKLLVDILKDEIRKEASEDGSHVTYWEEIECKDWGYVNHGYWWRLSRFALQLSENFTGDHVVRALELFPRRGTDFNAQQRIALDELMHDYPHFTYWWNGRTVYKFPVAEIREAKALGEKLAQVFLVQRPATSITSDSSLITT